MRSAELAARGSFWHALHVATLWVLAVAAPLFEVLRRDPEFFVAYRASRADVMLFAAVVSVLTPAALAILVVLTGRVSQRWQRRLTLSFLALGAALVASQGLIRLAPPAVWHVAGSIAIGAAAAVLYARFAAARLFVSFLSVALVAVPLLFVLHPSMAAFVFPEPPPSAAPARAGKAAPIVLIVFDQLPLASLMNAEKTIDPAEFPGFAALARTSTWFRHASTVAELTQWAIPPIVTGRYPRPGRLPIAARYPENLFTFLAGSHGMTAIEPLTALCPASICASGGENGGFRPFMMLADAAVVYAHIISPPALARRLPPLTHSWKGFAASGGFGDRWNTERDRDRRRSMDGFLRLLRKPEARPHVYFLHALLPHEPYLYLRSGQQYDDVETPLYGNLERGRWTTEPWPVVQAYRRHLLQVQYIDAYVERLIERLVSQGMFDETLLIVTADHGASFRPGKPFKALEDVTIRDIAPVPLFVKLPFQHEGSVDDRNVQSIDILPTIADALGLALTWKPDGVSMIDRDAPLPASKLVFHRGATTRTRITPAELDAGGEAAARRAAFFGPAPAPDYAPAVAPHGDLLGREAKELPLREDAGLVIEVDEAKRFLSVDPRGAVVPSMITGRVLIGRSDRRALAIAVNGRIAATTYTYSGQSGAGDGIWSAFLIPRFFRSGRNSIDVYEVQTASARVLVRGYMSDVPISTLNLVSTSTEKRGTVRLHGFYEPDGPEGQPFRWTSGAATAIVPPGAAAGTPRSLLVGLALARPGGGRLQIAIDGCKVFDGHVASAPWRRTFSLRACPVGDLDARGTRITLESDVFRPSSRDPRQLGVAVENLRLLEEDRQ